MNRVKQWKHRCFTNIFRLYSTSSSSSQIKGTQHSLLELDDAERETILGLLNSMSLEEMRKLKGVSMSVATEIYLHKQENGAFTEVEELMGVRRLGTKSYTTLCNDLKGGKPTLRASNEKKETSSPVSAFKQITPDLTTNFLKTVGEVTSLEFGSESLHYTSMTPDFTVSHWQHIPLLNTNYQKQTPVQLIEEAYRLVDLLPKSDMFLIENRMIRKLNPGYMQMLLFIKCLQTAVQILLNSDFAETNQHKVFHMKDSLTIKTFNLRVGSERISGQHVLQQIEEDEYEDNVKISPALWRHFDSLRSDILQERYCNSLLIVLAFCHHFHQYLLKPEER